MVAHVRRHPPGRVRQARGRPTHIGSFILSFEAQLVLERAFKGLLSAGNDDIRFRRDAALGFAQKWHF